MDELSPLSDAGFESPSKAAMGIVGTNGDSDPHAQSIDLQLTISQIPKWG